MAFIPPQPRSLSSETPSAYFSLSFLLTRRHPIDRLFHKASLSNISCASFRSMKTDYNFLPSPRYSSTIILIASISSTQPFLFLKPPSSLLTCVIPNSYHFSLCSPRNFSIIIHYKLLHSLILPVLL